MAITLQEAIQIAEKNKYADKLVSIREYHDRYKILLLVLYANI